MLPPQKKPKERKGAILDLKPRYFSSNVWYSVLCARVRCSIYRAQLLKGLDKVLDDIVNVLDTNRYTDQVSGDTGGELFFSAELLMGGGGGVDDQSPTE